MYDRAQLDSLGDGALVDGPAKEAGQREPVNIGRIALIQRADKLAGQANLLYRLAEAIPQNFPADASDGLASLVYNQRS